MNENKEYVVDIIERGSRGWLWYSARLVAKKLQV